MPESLADSVASSVSDHWAVKGTVGGLCGNCPAPACAGAAGSSESGSLKGTAILAVALGAGMMV